MPSVKAASGARLSPDAGAPSLDDQITISRGDLVSGIAAEIHDQFYWRMVSTGFQIALFEAEVHQIALAGIERALRLSSPAKSC